MNTHEKKRVKTMRDPNEDYKIYVRLAWLFTIAFALITVSLVVGKPLATVLLVIATIIIAFNIIEGDEFFY